MNLVTLKFATIKCLAIKNKFKFLWTLCIFCIILAICTGRKNYPMEFGRTIFEKKVNWPTFLGKRLKNSPWDKFSPKIFLDNLCISKDMRLLVYRRVAYKKPQRIGFMGT